MGKKDNYTSVEVSILSHDVNVEGKITSNGNVRIDGKVVGDVVVKGNLTIGETANIEGNVSARNILNGGKVKGTLNAEEKVTLESTSVLEGDLYAATLVINEGARFEGKSSMTKSENAKQ